MLFSTPRQVFSQNFKNDQKSSSVWSLDSLLFKRRNKHINIILTISFSLNPWCHFSPHLSVWSMKETDTIPVWTFHSLNSTFGFRGKSMCDTVKSGRVMHDFQTEWIIMTIDILYLSFYFDTLAHLQTESPQPPIRADLRCGKWNVNFCVLTPIFLTFVVVVVTAVSCGTMRDKTVTKHFQFLWPDAETKLLQVLFNIHSTCLSAKHTCRY